MPRDTPTENRLAAEIDSAVAAVQPRLIAWRRAAGAVIALRVDMDGLPVTERTDVPFASKERTMWNRETVGVIHACGHDARVAILMSVATVLAGLATAWPAR